jgi:hypothetical protein
MSRLVDGVDQNITVPSLLGIATTNITIQLWVKILSLTESGAFVKIGNEGVGAANNGIAIGVGGSTFDGTGNDLIALYEGIRWIDTNSLIGLGWHHVAIAVNGSSVPFLYKDGTFINSFSGTGMATPTLGGTKIGGYTGNAGENRFGNYNLAHVQVHTVQLTLNEIIHSFKFPGSIRRGMVTNGALFHLMSGGDTEPDYSGNGNVGTVNNGALYSDDNPPIAGLYFPRKSVMNSFVPTAAPVQGWYMNDSWPIPMALQFAAGATPTQTVSETRRRRRLVVGAGR